MVDRGGCVCRPKLGECVPEEWESMEGGQAGERRGRQRRGSIACRAHAESSRP